MALRQTLETHLPFLRRYARALSGSQGQGDAAVRATLAAIVADPTRVEQAVDERTALYAVFQEIWDIGGANVPIIGDTDDAEDVARARLARIAPLPRQALLLTAMEGFSVHAAATILGIDPLRVDIEMKRALVEIDAQMRARVLIIEDEPLISESLVALVEDLGHRVTAVARTRNAALDAVLSARPTLILSDIQLADGSSGLDAVRDIEQSVQAPVIFITAFPELLLTGERPEPTFFIAKPFRHREVTTAIAQALFFDTATVPA